MEEEWPRSERWAHFLNPDVYKPTLSINSECEPHRNKTGQMRHGEATLHSERKGEFWNKGWVVKIVYGPQNTKDKNQFLSTVHKIKGYPCNTEEWTRAQISEFKNYRLWSNKPARLLVSPFSWNPTHPSACSHLCPSSPTGGTGARAGGAACSAEPRFDPEGLAGQEGLLSTLQHSSICSLFTSEHSLQTNCISHGGGFQPKVYIANCTPWLELSKCFLL